MSHSDDALRAIAAAKANRLRDEYASEFARLAADLVRPPRPPRTQQEDGELDEMILDLTRMFNDEEDETNEF